MTADETPSRTSVRIGRIVVGEVSETLIRSAFPDCEVVAAGADFQITVQLRDLADVYPFLIVSGRLGQASSAFPLPSSVSSSAGP
jgi:hypothetical protein